MIPSESTKEGKTHWGISGWKDQNKTADKSNNAIWRDKSEDIGERRDIMTGSTNNKQNRTFENKERNFCLQVGGERTWTNQQPDAKEAKQFPGKIWEQKEHNRKAE